MSIHEQKIIYNGKYQNIGNIARGAFSVVKKVKNLETNQVLAMKIILNSNLSNQVEEIVREVTILKSLNHSHIVKYIDNFAIDFSYFIAMEFCQSDLRKKIIETEKNNTKLEFELILWFTFQIVDALEYLHANKIIHRDIKPDNIFLQENDIIKLGDFNISRQSENTIEFSTFVGTLNYMSPEILDNQEYSYNTDVWSLGCTLYELITLKKYYEFYKKNRLNGNEILPKLEINNNEFIQILKKMLLKDKRIRSDIYKIKKELVKTQSEFYLNKLILKGTEFYNLKKYDEAIEFYNQAIEINSNFSKAFSSKGLALHSINKYTEAIKCYDEAIKLDPNDAQTFNNKGIALNNSNKYNEAIECFNKAIKINPNDSKAYYYKGFSLQNLNEHTEAIECYNKTITLNPNDAQVFNHKGIALRNLNKYAEAIKCYDEAIKLDSNYSEAFNNKGVALQNLNEYFQAIDCYNEAIKLNPFYSDAFYNKGVALNNLNKYTDAIACYNKAIKLNPNYSEAYNNKGVALFYLKNYTKAIECYNMAIELNPNDSEAYNNKYTAIKNLNKYID